MRISDWSSDVCSSDLPTACAGSPTPRRTAIGTHRAARTIVPAHAHFRHRPWPRKATVQAEAAARSRDGQDAPRATSPKPPDRSDQGARHSSRSPVPDRSEEHTSELQSLMRISYAVFCLKKKKQNHHTKTNTQLHN